MHRPISRLVLLLIVTIALTGCIARPPDFTVADVKFDWSGGIGKMTGRIANTGGSSARYLEMGVKITPSKDDPNHILATGWTNFTNFAPGESRSFTIYLLDDFHGDFYYWWRWSTTVGGAMY